MKRLIIKVKSDPKSNAIDLEVPGNQPVRDLLPHLVKGMGWPDIDSKGNQLYYWFFSEAGILDENIDLTQAGITNGMTLEIGSGINKPVVTRTSTNPNNNDNTQDGDSYKSTPPEKTFEFEKLEIPQNISVQDRRATIRPPSEWKKVEDDEIDG